MKRRLLAGPVLAADPLSLAPRWGRSSIRRLALLGLVLVLVSLPANAFAQSVDPVLGDWNSNYGDVPGVVTITESDGTFTMTGKTAIRVQGASCDLPAGTELATFTGSSPMYAGQHGLWFVSNCAFASYTSLTLTLEGNALTGVLGSGGSFVYTRSVQPEQPAEPTAEPTTSGSGPSGLISDRSPTFTFSSDDAGASFECSLDGGAYSTCSAPYSPTGLDSGDHTLSVRAVSAAGVVDSSPLSFSFTIAQVLSDLPAPQLGRNVNVQTVSGTVLVRVPGGRYVPLDQARQIKVGSYLDTRRGTVRLVSATGSGSKTQAGNFFQGIFQIRQSRKKNDKGLTELRLSGASFRSCQGARGASGSAYAAAASKKKIRSLRGVAKGRFRTRGRNASATVRGTNWGTIDRCDGTLTRVRSGRVAVRDFIRKRTIILRTGQTYLARARR